MMNPMDELRPPTRLMLTPGPSCLSPRVYGALATRLVGHVDPWFTDFMGGVQELLRRVSILFDQQNLGIVPSGIADERNDRARSGMANHFQFADRSVRKANRIDVE